MQSFDEREKIVNLGLIHIVDNEKPIRQIFNKEKYASEFTRIYELYTQALTAYNFLYETQNHSEEYAREVAGRIIDYEVEKINGISRKGQRNQKVIDDSIYTALFVIPAIDHFHTEATDRLADFLVEEWLKKFPKNQIERGDFESINGGFRERRSLLDLLRGK